MKSPYFLLGVILLVASCSRQDKSGQFTIKAQFSNPSGQKVILCEMGVKEIVPLDSVTIGPDHSVLFTQKLDQPGFYLLILPGGNRVTLVMNKEEKLNIRGDLRDPDRSLVFSGSKETGLLQDFFHQTLKNKVRIDSVKRMLSSKEGSEDFLRYGMKADSLFMKISTDQKKLETDFINRNPASLASLIVLNYSFGPSPVLSMETDLPYYQKLTGLYRIYPKNKHVVYHLERVRLFMNNKKLRGN